MKKNLAYLATAVLTYLVTACQNSDNEFSNFDYQTVYFANQYASRTVELGEDLNIDNTLDNQHKIRIKATWGGGYNNPQKVIIDFKVDESLCEGLYFKDTDIPVLPMPSEYYELADNQITIPAGQITGGVEVQLTDAFFADPKNVETTYVIPLRMTDVQGADSILSGKPIVDEPILTKTTDWSIQPKNYVLYAVKYVNPYHGEYLRRGIDVGTVGGEAVSLKRHANYVEKDEVVQTSTLNLQKNQLTLNVKDADQVSHAFNINLQFTEDGTCTLSSSQDGVEVTGTGKFVSKGEKNSLGGKDRDAIYLDYSTKLTDFNIDLGTQDTLVLRTRNGHGVGTFDIEKR